MQRIQPSPASVVPPSLFAALRDVVLPTAVVSIVSSYLLRDLGIDLSFSPRGVIYSGSTIVPALISPWFWDRQTISHIVSRCLQCALFACLPPMSILRLWVFSFVVAIIRIPIGFIFTRSVGWALPRLFSHYALYETTDGFGPAILALVALNPAVAARLVSQPFVPYVVTILAATFAWLEYRAWTYGITLALILVLAVAGRIPVLKRRLSWLYPIADDGTTVDETTIDLTPGKPLHPSTPRPSPSLSSIVLAFSILIPFFVIRASRLPFPASPAGKPLLNVLILSYPRPGGVETSAELLSTTLDSFTPHLEDITVSVFTHAQNHDALDSVKDLYRDVEFHVDRDSHPQDVDGHFLHLAEAFRWAESNSAEWVMLMEDDFPICPGGWEVLSTMVNMLETDRLNDTTRAGFIGTGGSGIIFHHSYLRILQLTLRAYSAAESAIPQGVFKRAPDVVVQDCVMGRPHSLCERRKGKLIIPSRLMLDHIGGMATTTKNKLLNSDQWRCGWRHAFHGNDAVEVIVV